MSTTNDTDSKLKALFDEFDSLNERYDEVSESEQEEICEQQDSIIAEVFAIARGAEKPITSEQKRLIEFAKGVLEFIARDQDCGADTIGDIVEFATELCLADVVDTEDGELFAVTLEEYETKKA